MKKITLITNRFIDEEDIKMEVVAVDNASRVIENVARALNNATNSYEKYNNESNKQEQSNSKLVDLYKSLLVRVQNNLNAFNGLNRSIKATSSELKKIADINATLSTKAISGKLFDFGNINENDVISMFKAATSIEKTLSDMQERLEASITKQAEEEQKAAEAAEREAIAKQKSADTISKFKENMKVIKDEMDIISSLSKQTPLSSSEINKLSNIQQMFNVDDSKINDALVEKSAKSISATKKIIMDLESRIQKAQEQQAKDAQKAAEAAEREATAREKIVNSAIHDTSKSMGKGMYSRSYKETDGQSRQENFAKLQKILDNEQTAFGRLKNAITGATNEINKNSKAIDNNKKSVDNAGNSWTSFGKTLTGKLVRFRIVSSALKSTASTFLQLYETAASYEEALNLYTTSLGEYAAAGRKWADEISEALYLDPTSVLQYTGALYSLVQGLGVTSDAAYTMATNLTQLSYDMSSYLNIDVQSAYDKLQSAITGQSRAVATAGVALQQATLAELAHSLGIKKSVSEMTQAEKTYLRYIQIMRSTTNMQGDLAKTMITPENALRTIKTQFLLLAKAIGQVFIPIVLKAIPYVMALTQILTELAGKVSKWTGYKIADIDYSKLKLSSAAMEDLGDTADDTAGSINRTLAAFDDLNVVESESSKSGKNTSSVVGDLQEYITGYDMLKGLTGDFEKNVDSAREQLEKLWDVLKVVGEVIIGFKIAKFGGNLLSIFGGGSGLAVGLANTVSLFKDGYRYAKYFGKNGLTAVGSGLRNILSPAQKVGVAVGGSVAAFEGSNIIMQHADTTFSSMAGHILGSAGLTAALSTVGFVLGGPVVGGVIALAGAAGTAYGTYKKLKEEISEATNNQAEMYVQMERIGIPVEKVESTIDSLLSKYSKFYDESVNTAKAVDTARDSLEQAADAAGDLEIALQLEKFDDIKTAYDTITTTNNDMRDAIINVDTAERNRLDQQLTRLYEEGRITKEEYQSRMNVIDQYYDTLDAHAQGYYTELSGLQKELASGKITQDEYNNKVAELKEKYTDVSNVISNATGAFETYSNTMLSGIDLSKTSSGELQTKIDSLSKSHETYLENMKTGYDKQYEANDKVIQQMSTELSGLEEGTDAYNKKKEALETLMKTQDDLTKSYNEGVETVNAQYASVLKTIYAEMDNALKNTSADVDTDMAKVRDNIKETLKDFGDVDTSKSVVDFYKNYTDRMELMSKDITVKKVTTADGETVTGYFVDGSLKAVREANGEVTTEASTLGKYFTEGYAEGIEENGGKVTEVTKKMCNLSPDTIRAVMQIHSPSDVTEELGSYVTEGFALGLNDQSAMKTLENNTKNIVNYVKTALSNVNADMNINFNTNVESSFNSILTKLQSFCDKWRVAVNTLVSSTSNLMSSLKIASNGKLSYTSMPKINVQRFDGGGYPKSGDYFFANENGVPEYITSIGNRSAVVNQDQMVSALSNAIIAGMSRIPVSNQQPGNTVVYIGNEKVYEGQGTYQSRQADRYGTNYIKI